MHGSLRSLALAAAGAMLASAPVPAQPKVPAIFGDHMVLQRDRPIRLWGRARPTSAVAVTFRDRTAVTRTGDDGVWKLEVGPFAAGGPDRMIVAGDKKVVFEDVMVGEVWLCSGQSNMDMPVRDAAQPEEELAAASIPGLRLFRVEQKITKGRIEPEGTWRPCDPIAAARFSAVAYAFGRKLHRDLGVAVGLIQSSWSGTPAEAWTSERTIGTYAELQPALDRWTVRRAQWLTAVEEAKKEGRPGPPAPTRAHQPGILFENMVEPLAGYALRGVIWYQGESNVGHPDEYRTLFPALIADWRAAWQQGDFPFLFVQLANFRVREPLHWAGLREAQRLALRVPNTGMVVTTDLGDPDDIHPKNKQEVGRRLALSALAIAYGYDVVHAGPLFAGARVEGNAIRVRFEHVGSGLRARDGGALRTFEIAADDGAFVAADARIDGDSVVVRSPDIAQPRYVRYAYSDVPDANLINAEGLPASPFRTDDR